MDIEKLRKEFEAILKDKLKNININNSDYTFNKIIEAMEVSYNKGLQENKVVEVLDEEIEKKEWNNAVEFNDMALKVNKFIHEQCIDGTPHDIGWNVMKMIPPYLSGSEAVEVSDEELNDLVNKINTDWSGNYRAVFIRGMKFMRDKQGIAPCKVEEKKGLDLKTLRAIKLAFDMHSDHSTRCNGYVSLCKLLEQKEGEGKQ
ncbi:MAG: hypothetical protein V4547_09030 [Bacteroidota bacterium]